MRLGVPAVLGLAVGLGLGYGLAPRYRATAVLEVELTPSPDALSASTAAEALDRRLPAISSRITEAAGLSRPHGAVGVRVVGAKRIELTSVAGEADRAVAVANHLATMLVRQSVTEHAEGPPSGFAALEVRLAEMQRALAENREAMDRASRRRAAASSEPPGSGSRHARLRAEHANVAESLRAAQAKLEDVRRVGTDLSSPPEDPELARLRQELAALGDRYTDQHPDVEAVRRRIAERETVQRTSATALSSAQRDAQVLEVEREIGELSARLARLGGEMARLAQRGDASPTRSEGRLEALARERTSLEAAHSALLRDLAAAQPAPTSGDPVPAERFRVVVPASAPAGPFFPRRWVFALIGLSVGLAAGLGAAFVAEARDRSIRDVEDLETLLSLPVLAEIPFAPGRRCRRMP